MKPQDDVKPDEGQSASTDVLGRVSMGRNPNTQDCCGYPKCAHLKVDGNKSFGWCQHVDNFVESEGFANGGFTPSVSFTGYCDHHTARYP